MSKVILRLLANDEAGLLTPDDIAVLNRHYEQVLHTTAFLHQSASTGDITQ